MQYLLEAQKIAENHEFLPPSEDFFPCVNLSWWPCISLVRGKEAEGAEKLKLPKAEKSGKSSSSSTVPGGSGSVVKSSTTSGKVKVNIPARQPSFAS